jgi:hypothetical protein
MRHLPENLPEGRRIERRAIVGDTAEGSSCVPPRLFLNAPETPGCPHGGIVIQDLVEETLVTAIIDNGQNAEGAIIPFIVRHIA